MYRDNRRYIAENDTREDYLNLSLNINSANDKWDRAIEIFKSRIDGRYFTPMRTLIEYDVNSNGFAAMALCCLLIETLLQFQNGWPQTPGSNKEKYTQFLKENFAHIFDEHTAARFYSDIRCGILHSGQTKNGSCLTYNTEYIINNHQNGVMMVNVQRISSELFLYFQRYCEELTQPQNATIRKNFIIKMNDICRILEGTNQINTLWYAICAEENTLISYYGRNEFFYLQSPNPDTIFIPKHPASRNINYIRPNSSDIVISKNDIEKALYYWPNKQMINMLENSRYIYTILYKFRHLINDIIASFSA